VPCPDGDARPRDADAGAERDCCADGRPNGSADRTGSLHGTVRELTGSLA